MASTARAYCSGDGSGMRGAKSTLDVEYFNRTQAHEPAPGALLVFSGEDPKCGPVPIAGDPLVLGRGTPPELMLADPAMSRRHAQVSFDGARFTVADLGSRNGLVLDGTSVPPGGNAVGGRVLRIGRSVFLLVADLRPHLAHPLAVDGGEVVGPVLRAAWDEVERIASTGAVLHLHAESGAGKEHAARRFHALGKKPDGPFVAVNCAAIPPTVAERLLFGTKKGAFSGATENAIGYFQSADCGTLFLDEVGELDLDVQAKLLRVIETGEVMPLGASRAQRVDVRLVSATHHDMRRRVAERLFREDLYFRIGRPAVHVPALRERPEEMAYLAQRAVAAVSPSLRIAPAFVEALLLRPWPGNVRELLQGVEDAAHRAAHKGEQLLEPTALDENAGLVPPEPRDDEGVADSAGGRERPRSLPSDDVIAAALQASDGKVATAARELGVHRNQLRRWLQSRNVGS